MKIRTCFLALLFEARHILSVCNVRCTATISLCTSSDLLFYIFSALNGNPVGGAPTGGGVGGGGGSVSGNGGGLDPSFSRNIRHTVYAKPFPERQQADDADTPPDYSKDWHALAEVVDRLFFWTFFLAIIAISILLFHPLTKDFIMYKKEGT